MSNSAPQDPNTIGSVSSYMARLEQLMIEKNQTLFFRGSADCSWENKPSIFRNSKLIENEDHLYYDTLARCSDNFKHCDNTFENLVMMQHYSIPTRLLDITENPLVALYFACVKNEETDDKDAKVDIFQVEKTEIKRYDSDTVAMLANVVKMPSDFDLMEINFFIRTKILSEILIQRQSFSFIKLTDLNHFLCDIKERFEINTEKQKLKLSQNIGNINDFIYISESVQNEIFAYLEKKIEVYSDDFFTFIDMTYQFIIEFDEFSNYKKLKSQFLKYQHFIQSEKSYFNSELMQLNDLNKVICVKPKQDNPHIIRQSGAFFIFGINEEAHDKLSAPSIPDQYLCRQSDKVVSIRIPKDAKPEILKQLKALAISEGTLFTDIEKVAADLKEIYGK